MPVAYLAQVSSRDGSVDRKGQFVLTFSVKYLNCADGRLRSGVHGLRGNLRGVSTQNKGDETE